MIRKSVLLWAMLLVFLLSGTCWAEEKPFGEISNQQQAIDKLFTGRSLDPIEGIWYRDADTVLAIAKGSLSNAQNPKYKNSDYISIYLTGKNAGEVFVWFIKTEYDFAFNGHWFYREYDGCWKLLYTNVLQFDGRYGGNYSTPTQSFVRIYPAEKDRRQVQ